METLPSKQSIILIRTLGTIGVVNLTGYELFEPTCIKSAGVDFARSTSSDPPSPGVERRESAGSG
jgi:hypothetical protein